MCPLLPCTCIIKDITYLNGNNPHLFLYCLFFKRSVVYIYDSLIRVINIYYYLINKGFLRLWKINVWGNIIYQSLNYSDVINYQFFFNKLVYILYKPALVPVHFNRNYGYWILYEIVCFLDFSWMLYSLPVWKVVCLIPLCVY